MFKDIFLHCFGNIIICSPECRDTSVCRNTSEIFIQIIKTFTKIKEGSQGWLLLKNQFVWLKYLITSAFLMFVLIFLRISTGFIGSVRSSVIRNATTCQFHWHGMQSHFSYYSLSLLHMFAKTVKTHWKLLLNNYKTVSNSKQKILQVLIQLIPKSFHCLSLFIFFLFFSFLYCSSDLISIVPECH